MKSLSVKFKLFSGFGVIVAALIGVAILSVNGLGVVRDLLVEYRGAARQSLNVNSASLAMMEARLSFMKYRASIDPAVVTTLRAALDQNDEFARKLKDQLAGTDDGSTLDGLMTKAAAYARGVDAYVDAQAKVSAAVEQYTALGTKLRQDLSARFAEVARSEGADTVLRLSQFQEAMLRGRTFMERYVASLKDADLAEARSIEAEGTRALEAIGAVLKDTEHAAAIKALSDGYAAFVAQAETVAGLIAERSEARDTVDALGPELSKGYASLLDTIVGQQNTLGPQAQATAESTVTRTLVVSAVFALAGIAIALVLGFGLSRAITAITGSMRRLAGGDLDADIYGIGRRDEIGAMAGAVGVFKENAIERRRLEAEQEAAKAAAETEKRRMMAALADDFETAIGGIVSTVSASASQLQSSAQVLASTSEETSRQSAAVAAASEEASVNVQTVATASEELAVSVAEVGKQVSDSARMSDNAVAEAAATADKVKQLSIAADRIGSIVDLIQTISGQTNLLALNATIEAARAGEAGRGFAVVAAEVKNLADQTAKATTEIAQHIAAIQSTTADSVAAIDGISTLIRNLNQIATAIAGAVEEQGAATQEIARNVQQAAQGTSSVSGSIVEVQQAATEASGASSQVLGAASGLAEQAGRLRQELGRFLANVRAG